MKHPGRWEFPGGKIEPGETPEAGLLRELKEELNWHPGPVVLQALEPVVHAYPDLTVRLFGFLIPADEADFELTEHDAWVWTDLDAAESLNWLEADRPILARLRLVLPG